MEIWQEELSNRAKLIYEEIMTRINEGNWKDPSFMVDKNYYVLVPVGNGYFLYGASHTTKDNYENSLNVIAIVSQLGSIDSTWKIYVYDDLLLLGYSAIGVEMPPHYSHFPRFEEEIKYLYCRYYDKIDLSVEDYTLLRSQRDQARLEARKELLGNMGSYVKFPQMEIHDIIRVLIGEEKLEAAIQNLLHQNHSFIVEQKAITKFWEKQLYTALKESDAVFVTLTMVNKDNPSLTATGKIRKIDLMKIIENDDKLDRFNFKPRTNGKKIMETLGKSIWEYIHLNEIVKVTYGRKVLFKKDEM